MDIEKIKDLVHDSSNRLALIDWQFQQAEKVYISGASQEQMMQHFATCRQSLKVLSLIFTTINSPDRGPDCWVELNHCVREYKQQQGFLANCDILIREYDSDSVVHGITNIIVWRLLDNLLLNARNQGSDCVVIEVNSNSLSFTDNGGGVEDSIMEKLQRGERISLKGPSGGRGYSQIISLCKTLGWSYDVRNRQHEYGRGLSVRLSFNSQPIL
jgi:hypothetical protein